MSRVNKERLKSQVRIHWDDKDAVFLCNWFVPVTQQARNSNGKLMGPKTAVRVPPGDSGERTFQLPIACAEGYNWLVWARNGMVMCPAAMVWSEASKSYHLDRASEQLANQTAIQVTCDDNGNPQFTHVGEVAVRPLIAGGDAQAPSPFQQQEQDKRMKRKRKAHEVDTADLVAKSAAAVKVAKVAKGAKACI